MKKSGGKEPESAKQLRARQILDMSKLDEEENERIKNLFARKSGARAFRSSVRSTAGSGAPASGSVRGSGFRGGNSASMV
jgi:hypothetical protein